MAQNDTTSVNYKLERCIKQFNTKVFLEQLEKEKYSKKEILNIGRYISYHGNDKCGNELMKLCFAKHDSTTADEWHTYSVQNTKHGNYAEAVNALEKAVVLDPKEIAGYYGWVLLYYYRDYEKSLKYLNQYDNLSPDMEAPVGENIHFLKGLCYYQLQNFEKAIDEFKLNEAFEINKFKKKNTNPFIDFYIGRCLDKMDKKKEAERFYKSCIKYAMFPTEGYYYLGLMYQKQNKVKEARECFNKSLTLIKKGYKQQDVYVELFDEVYQTQIEEGLNN